MNDKLFVYGTLMLGQAGPMSNFLGSNATYIGVAKAEGFLYDLGLYPGFVYAPGCGSWVYGELFELRNPFYTLDVIDQYEGCNPLQDSYQEYSRLEIFICFHDQPLHVWCYVFNKPEGEDFPVIAGGNFKGYHKV